MVPASAAKMNRAAPDDAPSVTTKPAPLFATMPVGAPVTCTTNGERTPVAL
jgi:hypothetical protein